MAMSREDMRYQMQTQRPDRKRQLYEVAPSPPKKWKGHLSSVSPSSSPDKGPLEKSDEDDTSSFRARSFYRSKKTLPFSLTGRSVSSQDSKTSHHDRSSSSSPSEVYNLGTENVSTGSRRSSRGADKKTSQGDEKVAARPHRVALSPIKNVYSNIKKQPKGKAASKPVMARSGSMPHPKKAKPQPVRKSKPVLQPVIVKSSTESEESVSANTTPNNTRKFFKHKSPASAAKSAGAIIVGKGFNLKFVPGLLNKNFDISPGRRQGNSAKLTPASKTRKTYSRRRKVDQSASVEEGSQSTTSSHNTSISDLARSPNKEFTIWDEEPTESQSQSLIISDTLSLGSDVHEPLSGSRPDVQEEAVSDQSHKFYSIFSNTRCSRRLADSDAKCKDRVAVASTKVYRKKSAATKGDNSQLILDAGQEKFGATQCLVCGMVYTPADAADDATHTKFHHDALAALKFPGWKKERVIKEFLDDGSHVIAVLPEDPHFMVKKVEEVNTVMGQELGFPDHVFSFHGSIKAFLYISDEKRVEGCCLAESITEGYRILPSASKELGDSQRPWFCSSTPRPATVGIGRLWVYKPSRQSGIATRLLDCIRQWFEYGIVIGKSKIAFSDPTPDGRRFAAKYTGTPTFLVYKYQH